MEENNKIPIYTDNDGLTKIDVKLEEDTLWLTQAQMCELYQTSKSNVSEYIKHIFEEGELQEDSVVRKFRTTATDGKSYMTTFYNLDMIIALLDFAERQAEKEQPMTMNDWANYLDRILTSEIQHPAGVQQRHSGERNCQRISASRGLISDGQKAVARTHQAYQNLALTPGLPA